jgi:dimethylargininase
MLTAITRQVSPTLAACELEYLERQPIDIPKAIDQHRAYEQCLREAGACIVTLPADPQFPDGVFVEDPAIVLDEIAIITRMGAGSRRGEAQSIAEALAPFRELAWITEPATIEGGDVMRVAKTLFVGHSRRTNPQGIEQFSNIVKQFGYRVIPVEVTGCLHLKSACSPLSDSAILANRAWIQSAEFGTLQVIDVSPEEPSAANVLRIAHTTLNAASFPRTAEILNRAGHRVTLLDISELQKAEAALTCSSLIFVDGGFQSARDF